MMRSERGSRLATKSGRQSYVPERGDLVWLTFHPQAGHEQAGRRPAVVLSPQTYNKRAGLAVFVPVTRQQKENPFEVLFPTNLPISGVVLSDQLKSLDWRARETTFIARLPIDVVAKI